MTSWAQLWAELPTELQACCADKLLTPSAGRFSLASKACKDLVGEKLAEAKAAHEAALVEAAAARAAAQPRRRTKISAAGGDFIDTYVDEYKISSSTAREALSTTSSRLLLAMSALALPTGKPQRSTRVSAT